MFSRMTISTKLYFGFGLLIVMLSGLVVFGWWGVSQVQHNIDVLLYYGAVSDNVNATIKGYELAVTDSARHIYAKDEKYAAAVIEQIRLVEQNLNTIVEQVENDPYLPAEEHIEFLNKAKAVRQIILDFAGLEQQYSNEQKLFAEKDAAFRTKFRGISADFGKVLEAVDAPYKDRTASNSLEGDLPLAYFKMNKVVRDARGALTALMVAYDANQQAVGTEQAEKARTTLLEKSGVLNKLLPALNALPFDAKEKELLQQASQLIVELKADIDTVLEVTLTQGQTIAGVNKKTEEFDEASTALMDDVEKIYETAEAGGVKAASQSIVMIIGIGSLTVLLAIIIAILIARNITSGIHCVVSSMNVIVETGDLAVELPEKLKRRSDEIGNLTKSLSALMEQFRSVEHLAVGLAAGNWNTTAIPVRGEQDVMNINLNQMLDQVNQALGKISESVRQVSTGAGEVSSAATSLSSGAQESAASLEEITASMSEISNQTKTNAQSAGDARDLAQKATNAAAEGQTAMQNMTGAMDKITKNSSEIQRVIKVIDDIAFQTNLLALNAAVEAARAGAHGKGFAVVAEEVRNLAARSAKAAQETNELISTSGQEIAKGGEVANHTSEVLNTIVEQIKQTTDLVAGIAAASNEQAQGVEQVTIGLQQIDSVTQQNTAAAEESASAANEMTSMAKNLQILVGKFQLRE